MFSPSLQDLVVQAHVEELHRVAQTYNRGRVSAARIHEVDRPNATHLCASVKRAIYRMLGGGRRANRSVRSYPRPRTAVDSSAATPGPRP
jgi:hypothetical protein